MHMLMLAFSLIIHQNLFLWMALFIMFRPSEFPNIATFYLPLVSIYFLSLFFGSLFCFTCTFTNRAHEDASKVKRDTLPFLFIFFFPL